MKKISFAFLIVLSYLQTFSQEIVQLEKSLDSLKNLKESYQKKILLIDLEYSRIEKSLNQMRIGQGVENVFICTETVMMFESPNGLFSRMCKQ
jgi:hypothetical protein